MLIRQSNPSAMHDVEPQAATLWLGQANKTKTRVGRPRVLLVAGKRNQRYLQVVHLRIPALSRR
jgi:hypothetical protein